MSTIWAVTPWFALLIALANPESVSSLLSRVTEKFVPLARLIFTAPVPTVSSVLAKPCEESCSLWAVVLTFT